MNAEVRHRGPNQLKLVDISDSVFVDAMTVCASTTEVRRKLGLSKHVQKGAMLKRALALGLSTEHFRVGRTKLHISFRCKRCQRVVPLTGEQRPRDYCSEDCLRLGRAAALREAMTAECRTSIGAKIKETWQGDARQRRMDRINTPEYRAKLSVAVRRGITPALRAFRSTKAKAAWASDPALRVRFQEAATRSRFGRLQNEACLRRPHVPYVSPKGLVTMVRSRWERDFCCWCDEAGLSWKYEPCRVVVDGSPYTPDFRVFLDEGPVLVELHRVQTAKAGDGKLLKMQQARAHLEEPLVLLSEPDMAELRRQLRTGVNRGWAKAWGGIW
jgi:hypothetical protein